jgi:hypothetical protein
MNISMLTVTNSDPAPVRLAVIAIVIAVTPQSMDPTGSRHGAVVLALTDCENLRFSGGTNSMLPSRNPSS